jgi:drug/metabolite transporter (DMT)-like permease
VVYLDAAIVLSPLAILVGEIPNAHPSIAFLLRAWTMPTLVDWGIMSGLGLVWAGGMYFNARAYSTAPASVVAPFEYTNLPINVMWDVLLWQIFPTWITWAGTFLTIFSGLYVLYRERQKRLVIVA